MEPTGDETSRTEYANGAIMSDKHGSLPASKSVEKSESEYTPARENRSSNGSEAVLEEAPVPVRPYSAFNLWQKRLIVSLGAAAGWFSTSSSFIFFPAIPFLVRDLHESTERINLTVTSYLIASGVFPSIIAGLSDVYGRRPILIITLGSYVAVNIGLALQRSFGVLLGLRLLQSAAISGIYYDAWLHNLRIFIVMIGTFAFSYGILVDVTTPADRGGFIGLMSIL